MKTENRKWKTKNKNCVSVTRRNLRSPIYGENLQPTFILQSRRVEILNLPNSKSTAFILQRKSLAEVDPVGSLVPLVTVTSSQP
ncbi:unnamed protein product [Lactuca virosa]|uniref:Uncharacterized protein n=1 Tax=Lactuca virosa TaxID=75947 RepID=A0AAU9MDV0_9ASTR|nr:unnamed protein product [Lactuca virosa]CAH1437720.1 unnamed protein product [Lactuca virosa]